MSTTSPTPAHPLHTPIPFLHVAFTPNGVRLFDEHGAAWLAIPEMGSDDKEESVARFAVSAVNAHAANEAKITALVKTADIAERRLDREHDRISRELNEAVDPITRSGLARAIKLLDANLGDLRAALALART